jgi:hypothetical protein
MSGASTTGVATYIRLIDARIEDVWLMSGMNRFRSHLTRHGTGARARAVSLRAASRRSSGLSVAAAPELASTSALASLVTMMPAGQRDRAARG